MSAQYLNMSGVPTMYNLRTPPLADVADMEEGMPFWYVHSLPSNPVRKRKESRQSRECPGGLAFLIPAYNGWRGTGYRRFSLTDDYTKDSLSQTCQACGHSRHGIGL
jgi:hypothetical protein